MVVADVRNPDILNFPRAIGANTMKVIDSVVGVQYDVRIVVMNIYSRKWGELEVKKWQSGATGKTKYHEGMGDGLKGLTLAISTGFTMIYWNSSLDQDQGLMRCTAVIVTHA